MDVAAVIVAARTIDGCVEDACIGGMLFNEPANDPELLLGVDSRLLRPVRLAPGNDEVVGVPTAETELETEAKEAKSGRFRFAGDSDDVPTDDCIKADEARAEAGPWPPVAPIVVGPPSPLPKPLNLTDWQ